MNLVVRFLRDEAAATAIEYALIACGIAFVIVSIVSTLGTTIRGRYTLVQDALEPPK